MKLEQQELASRFGRNLARCRKRADLSQEDVGVLASLHRTEIGMLERGVRLPRIDTVLKLAAALEFDVGDLVEGMEWIPAAPRLGHFRLREDD